jgi:hypothetical protein
MDGSCFDAITRSLRNASSRRGALTVLLSTALGLSF